MGWLERVRRRPTEAERALYVHLASDGGILVVRGETGEQLWTDREGLRRELSAVKQRKGLVLYTREAPDADPPREVEETFHEILSFRLPIKLLAAPHPDASASPEERQSVLRPPPGSEA